MSFSRTFLVHYVPWLPDISCSCSRPLACGFFCCQGFCVLCWRLLIDYIYLDLFLFLDLFCSHIMYILQLTSGMSSLLFHFLLVVSLMTNSRTHTRVLMLLQSYTFSVMFPYDLF